MGIDSPDPASLTKNLEFKDTWHVALGAQYKLIRPWLLDFGVAYDSEFQDNSARLAHAARELRVAVRHRCPEAGEHDLQLGSRAPSMPTAARSTSARRRTRRSRSAAAGISSERIGNTGILFFGANFNWKF